MKHREIVAATREYGTRDAFAEIYRITDRPDCFELVITRQGNREELLTAEELNNIGDMMKTIAKEYTNK